MLLNYMHLVLLGNVKKIIHFLLYGPPSAYKLSSRAIEEINARLKEFVASMPGEFQRRLRSISDFKYWKATEFRTFFLYTGPVALKGIISDAVFENFMLLHLAISTLVNPVHCMKPANVDYAESYLEQFVNSFDNVYHPAYASYNVQCFQIQELYDAHKASNKKIREATATNIEKVWRAGSSGVVELGTKTTIGKYTKEEPFKRACWEYWIAYRRTV